MTQEQRDLVEENHNLIYWILRKLDLSIEDYYDVAAIGLCKAAIRYDASMTKFSTYAYACMKLELLAQLKRENTDKMKIEKFTCSYNECLDDDYNEEILSVFRSPLNTDGNATGIVHVTNFYNTLTDKQKFVFQMKCLGYTNREIGAILFCTPANVTGVLRTVRRKYLKYKG